MVGRGSIASQGWRGPARPGPSVAFPLEVLTADLAFLPQGAGSRDATPQSLDRSSQQCANIRGGSAVSEQSYRQEGALTIKKRSRVRRPPGRDRRVLSMGSN